MLYHYLFSGRPASTQEVSWSIHRRLLCHDRQDLNSHRRGSPLQHLPFAMLADPIKQDHMKAFLWTAEEQWGNPLVTRQLEEVGIIDTLDPQPYLDNQQTNKIFPILKEEVTPKAGDKYIQASILIPCGNVFACVQQSAASTMLRETSLGVPMTIPSLTLGFMTLSLLMTKSLPPLSMPLPKLYMHSVTLTEMCISSWMNSLMSSTLMMPSH